MLANHTLLYPSIVPNMFIEVPEKDPGFCSVALTHRKASLVLTRDFALSMCCASVYRQYGSLRYCTLNNRLLSPATNVWSSRRSHLFGITREFSKLIFVARYTSIAKMLPDSAPAVIELNSKLENVTIIKYTQTTVCFPGNTAVSCRSNSCCRDWIKKLSLKC